SALNSSDEAIVSAYVAKTGLSEDELMELMRNETYMSAREAVNKGFADEIMSFEDYQAVASVSDSFISQDMINQFKSDMQEIENMKLEIEKEEILQGL
ncbi:ATP-dependent Clp protease proteolytic subunit, partial [Streptococcus agalactiae]